MLVLFEKRACAITHAIQLLDCCCHPGYTFLYPSCQFSRSKCQSHRWAN